MEERVAPASPPHKLHYLGAAECSFLFASDTAFGLGLSACEAWEHLIILYRYVGSVGSLLASVYYQGPDQASTCPFPRTFRLLGPASGTPTSVYKALHSACLACLVGLSKCDACALSQHQANDASAFHYQATELSHTTKHCAFQRPGNVRDDAPTSLPHHSYLIANSPVSSITKNLQANPHDIPK